MGITCKTTGKFQSIMRKMENQLEAERRMERRITLWDLVVRNKAENSKVL